MNFVMISNSYSLFLGYSNSIRDLDEIVLPLGAK
jgi:hypothetical protein